MKTAIFTIVPTCITSSLAICEDIQTTALFGHFETDPKGSPKYVKHNKQWKQVIGVTLTTTGFPMNR